MANYQLIAQIVGHRLTCIIRNACAALVAIKRDTIIKASQITFQKITAHFARYLRGIFDI